MPIKPVSMQTIHDKSIHPALRSSRPESFERTRVQGEFSNSVTSNLSFSLQTRIHCISNGQTSLATRLNSTARRFEDSTQSLAQVDHKLRRQLPQTRLVHESLFFWKTIWNQKGPTSDVTSISTRRVIDNVTAPAIRN